MTIVDPMEARMTADNSLPDSVHFVGSIARQRTPALVKSLIRIHTDSSRAPS